MEFPDIPQHQIIKRLGAGGMAHIFLADHTFLKTKVAVKVMAPDLNTDPTYAERFLREARIAAQLDHPNIVRIRDGGQVGELHYLTMEYLAGGNLRDEMRKGMSLAEAIQVTREIARALQYLATRNFVHRDLKPENVLMRSDLAPVLCDFGIAKEIEKRDPNVEELTAGPMMIGTLSYMSPEQAWGDPVDGRSDLYSLGVIFYEMLTGKVPIRGKTRAEHRELLLSEPVPGLPGEISPFQVIIDKALAKHPDDRYQNGLEMVAALDKLEEEEVELTRSGRTVIGAQDDLESSRRTGLSHLLTMLSRAFSGGRTGSSRKSNSSAMRRIRSRKATRRRWMLFGAGGVVLITAAALWLNPADIDVPTPREWMADGTPTEQDDRAAEVESIGAYPQLGNAGELLAQANQAMDEERLYDGDGDDAETYLTNLLVLHPEHAEGRQAMERLYTIYLDKARQALEQNDLQAAQELLDQSTLVSDLVEDRELVASGIALRGELTAARKQQLIAEQRQAAIDKLLNDARHLYEQGNTISPSGASAYDKYREVLSLDPDNDAARQGIMDLTSELLQQARVHLQDSEVAQAQAYVNIAVRIYPQHPEIDTVRAEIASSAERIARQRAEEELRASEAERTRLAAIEEERRKTEEKIRALLQAAAQDIEAGRLGAPKGNNAIDKYNQVVTLDPANSEAVAGFEAVAERYIQLAREKIGTGDLKGAERELISAQLLAPTNPRFIEAQSALIAAKDRREREAEVERERKAQVAGLLDAARSARDRGNIFTPRGDNALDIVRNLLEIDKDNAQAQALRAELLSQVAETARADITGRRFTEANIAMAAMKANNADPAALAQLRELVNAEVLQIARETEKAAREKAAREKVERQRLAAEEAKAQKAREQAEPEKAAGQAAPAQQDTTASRVSELLDKASRLGRIRDSNYRELAQTYRQVLEIQSQNT
ncbi:MAG: protein kinase, partial [Halioglobus sp.]|nr:protein kinase [Halioglobus sp.]